MRLDAQTGVYQADLQVLNTGEAIGRQLAIVFENLPEGLTLLNASGADENGNPYLNDSRSLQQGGLATQGISNVIEVAIANPNGVQFDWSLQALSGGPNEAPVFEAVEIPELLPGGVFRMPLQATDPNGDLVQFSLDSTGELPNVRFTGNGVLEFRPDARSGGVLTRLRWSPVMVP